MTFFLSSISRLSQLARKKTIKPHSQIDEGKSPTEEPTMTAKLLQMPPPKQINLEAELPGFTRCGGCDEILVDHCPVTRRCPIMIGQVIVGYSAVRLFRTSEFQDIPYV